MLPTSAAVGGRRRLLGLHSSCQKSSKCAERVRVGTGTGTGTREGAITLHWLPESGRKSGRMRGQLGHQLK